MANKGKSRHLKRLSMPKTYVVKRKGVTWIAKALPGKHSTENGYPLVVLLREVLKIVNDKQETKQLMKQKLIEVDGLVPKDLNTVVGLNDVIHLPAEKTYYRMSIVGGKLVAVQIKADEAKFKYCKIVGKTFLKKGKVQLNLHDGRNYIVAKGEDKFKLGDVLKLGFPKQKLEGVVKLEKGTKCYVAFGRNSGETGVLEEIIEHAGSKESDARLKTQTGEIITLKNYLFPIDDVFKI
ncbi:30S ribosomal protein S4e [uncultured archaeon]|nr:30S ribosomal protein S4e [uncultured archaeon]